MTSRWVVLLILGICLALGPAASGQEQLDAMKWARIVQEKRATAVKARLEAGALRAKAAADEPTSHWVNAMSWAAFECSMRREGEQQRAAWVRAMEAGTPEKELKTLSERLFESELTVADAAAQYRTESLAARRSSTDSRDMLMRMAAEREQEAADADEIAKTFEEFLRLYRLRVETEKMRRDMPTPDLEKHPLRSQ